MKVAVNIVTFNSAHDIAACLESLRRQTFTDFEIHILDNASSDDTLKIVEPFDIAYLARSPVNTGFCKAHNELARRFPSEYVLFLNPDTELTPSFIEDLARALDARPDAASASGKLLRMDGKPSIPPASSCCANNVTSMRGLWVVLRRLPGGRHLPGGRRERRHGDGQAAATPRPTRSTRPGASSAACARRPVR